VFEFGQVASGETAWEKLGRGSLQPRLGRDHPLVELFQAFAPPRKLDGAHSRLRRSCDNVSHRILDVEQCIKRGPQLDRPVKPDEVAVAQPTDR
jgi:hypothetical protein